MGPTCGLVVVFVATAVVTVAENRVSGLDGAAIVLNHNTFS